MSTNQRQSPVLLKTLCFCIAIVGSNAARAQGIPVIDVAAIAQAIEQVRAWEAQYKQMLQTIEQQRQIIEGTSGSRQLGLVSNAITTGVLPTNISQQLSATKNHDQLNALALQNFNTLNQAMQTRASQIQDLMRQINATQDAKSIQELSARIESEQVMATNEAKEAQWLKSQVEMQARAIDLERKNQLLYGSSVSSGPQ